MATVAEGGVVVATAGPADTSASQPQPTIKRMIDRFRYASPTSREDRSNIDPTARPDFWWAKMAPTANADGQPAHQADVLAASGGAAAMPVDPRVSFASFLSDTAPYQSTYRYNPPTQAGGGGGALAGPAQELADLTARLFGKLTDAEPSYGRPAVAPETKAPGKSLPSSASIVAEDLDQALAGFRSRFKVDEGKAPPKPRVDEFGYDVEDDEEGVEEAEAGNTRGRAGGRAGHESDTSLTTSRRLNFTADSRTREAGGLRASTDGLDMSSMRASLSRAQALTAALRGGDASASFSSSGSGQGPAQASSRPPTGRNSVNVSFDGAQTAGRASGAEARRRRLSSTLSTLAEGLDVSMLTLSRRLAALSGDPALLLETGAALLPSAEAVSAAAEAREAAGQDPLPPVSGVAERRLRESLDMASPRKSQPVDTSSAGFNDTGASSTLEEATATLPPRIMELDPPVPPPSSDAPPSPSRRVTVAGDRADGHTSSPDRAPLSPRQAKVQREWRETWNKQAGTVGGGGDVTLEPSAPGQENRGPAPALTGQGPSTPAPAPERKADMAAALLAAMEGNVSAFVAALDGRPVPSPTLPSATAEQGGGWEGLPTGRATRFGLTLDPTGRLSPGLLRNLQDRRMSGAGGLQQQQPVPLQAPAQRPVASFESESVASHAAVPATPAPAPGPVPTAQPTAAPALSSVDLTTLTTTNAEGTTQQLTAQAMLSSSLNTSLTGPGSSFIPLTAFIPAPTKPRAVLGSDGGPVSITAAFPHGDATLSADAQALSSTLLAAYSLPSAWGRPPRAGAYGATAGGDGAGGQGHVEGAAAGAAAAGSSFIPYAAASAGGTVDMSALQAQALEATLHFGAAYPPVLGPFSGVGGGGGVRGATPGRPGGYGGYSEQHSGGVAGMATPGRGLLPTAGQGSPAGGWGLMQGPTPGTVTIPAELGSAFAAFMQEQSARSAGVPSPRAAVMGGFPGLSPSVGGGARYASPGRAFLDAAAEYGGPVPLLPPGAPTPSHGHPLAMAQAFPLAGGLSTRSYDGPAPPAPGGLAQAWPTARMPGALSLTSGLPSRSPGHGAYSSSLTGMGSTPAVSKPSPVAVQADSLAAAHDDLSRRATAVLGMTPADMSRDQAARIAARANQARLEAQVADARKMAAAVPTVYDRALPPSSVTVEAQLTYRRAQEALAASARLRAQLRPGFSGADSSASSHRGLSDGEAGSGAATAPVSGSASIAGASEHGRGESGMAFRGGQHELGGSGGAGDDRDYVDLSGFGQRAS